MILSIEYLSYTGLSHQGRNKIPLNVGMLVWLLASSYHGLSDLWNPSCQARANGLSSTVSGDPSSTCRCRVTCDALQITASEPISVGGCTIDAYGDPMVPETACLLGYSPSPRSQERLRSRGGRTKGIQSIPKSMKHSYQKSIGHRTYCTQIQ